MSGLKEASVANTINDDEGGLHQDYEKWLERLAPHTNQFLNTFTTGPERTTPTLISTAIRLSFSCATSIRPLVAVPGVPSST